MTDGIGPSSDLPFDPKVIDYIAVGLKLANVDPDRAWLKAVEPQFRSKGERDWYMGTLLARMDVYSVFQHSRAAVPKSHAHREHTRFMTATLTPAIFDLSQAVIRDYISFAFLYSRLLGRDATPWLPSLYLAAAASPSIDTEHRTKLIGRFDPNQLESH